MNSDLMITLFETLLRHKIGERATVQKAVLRELLGVSNNQINTMLNEMQTRGRLIYRSDRVDNGEIKVSFNMSDYDGLK